MVRWLRRFGLAVAAGVALAGAGVAAALSAPAGAPHPATTTTIPAGADRLADNRAAARRAASALLAAIPLPAGATARPAKRPAGAFVGTLAGVERAAAWQIPRLTPDRLVTRLEAARPHDAMIESTGTIGSSTGPTAQVVTFSFPAVPGVLTGRYLMAEASPDANGSALALESEAVYDVPRTAASAIPAGASAVIVSAVTGRGRELATRTVTAPARIARIRRFFNGLEAAQPEVVNCPAMLTDPARITVTFRRVADASTTVLAQASFLDYFQGDAGACDPITLTVDGRTQDALWAPHYERDLERLFRVGLPAATV